MAGDDDDDEYYYYYYDEERREAGAENAGTSKKERINSNPRARPCICVRSMC